MSLFGNVLPFSLVLPPPPEELTRQVKLPSDFSLDMLGASVRAHIERLPDYVGSATEEGKLRVAKAFVQQVFCGTTAVQLVDAGRYTGQPVQWIPGHIIGDKAGYFPKKAKIMVIGKALTLGDSRSQRLFSGDAGELLALEFAHNGLNLTECYGTNAVKFYPPYAGMKTLPKQWEKEGFWFVQQEVEMVQPDYILLMGSTAVHALYGAKASIQRMRGTVSEYKGAHVMVSANPADMIKNPDKMLGFKDDVARFAHKVRGTSAAAVQGDYYYVYNLEDLRAVVDMCMPYTSFAMDCEWFGDSWLDGHLLTIQFSKQAGEAFVVVLRLDVDNFSFSPSPAMAIEELRRLLCRPDVRICGHNFRADMKWLLHYGLDLTAQFCERGFDTMLAHHLLAENREHNLTACAMQDAGMGRYDIEVENYLARKIVHGQMPSSVLLPYAAADADASFRLWIKYADELWAEHVKYAKDLGLSPVDIDYPLDTEAAKKGLWHSTRWNLLRHIVLPVNSAISEIEMTGLLVDEKRIGEIATAFATKRDQYLGELRTLIGDDEFNPRSSLQVSRLLFGKPGGVTKDGTVKPALGLEPFKTTGKPSKMWSECLEAEEVYWLEDPVYGEKNGKRVMLKGAGWSSDFHSPASDAETLAWLSEEKDVQEAEWLMNYRFLDQICKTFTAEAVDNGHGELEYEKGLGAYIQCDGRIHGSFSQLSETGRYKSYDPNCQNWPKGREGALAKIFTKDEKVPPIRTVLIAPPGWVLMEADLESAELYTMAYVANDHAMKEDLNQRNVKGEKISLHTIGAIKYFDLKMTPEEFDTVRKRDGPEGKRLEGLRIGAKSVNFGGN
jgi:uracil-DNA glycosylase family 4